MFPDVNDVVDDWYRWEERMRIGDLRFQSQQIYYLYMDGEIDGWDAVRMDKRINRALEEYAIHKQTASF